MLKGMGWYCLVLDSGVAYCTMYSDWLGVKCSENVVPLLLLYLGRNCIAYKMCYYCTNFFFFLKPCQEYPQGALIQRQSPTFNPYFPKTKIKQLTP